MGGREIGSARALIYVHGTNGSGKSSLARYLIMCSGGIRKMDKHPKTGAKVTYTHGNLALVGWYRSPTGGADGVQPYADVPRTALALLRDGHDVLVEGLMTPGVNTCVDLYNRAVKLGAYVKFIKLDIGIFKCIQHVKWRRRLAGNTKPLDEHNLRKKHATCERWFENLAAARIQPYGLDWNNTKSICMQAFKLNIKGATRILT